MKPTRKKSAKFKYPGPLGEPLVKRGALLGYSEKAEEWFEQDRAERLYLVVDLYQAWTDDGKVDWKLLALSLACHHIPGFQTVETPTRGRGRPKKSHDGFEFYMAVLEVMDKRKTSVANACRLLREKKGGPWYEKKLGTLETKFHDDKRRLLDLGLVPEMEPEGLPSAKYPKPPPDWFAFYKDHK